MATDGDSDARTGSAGGPPSTSRRDADEWAQLAICCALVAVPFLVVDFPPSTDLAQHVAQVRLLWEAAQGTGAPYSIQLWTPYNLGYAVIGAFYAVAGPVRAGRLSLLFVALLWTAAAHLLAARCGRSPASATIASLFVFNLTLYWGFFNFFAGWPVFAVWLLLTRRDAGRGGRRRRDGAALLAVGLLLYAAHALWLAAAVAWLVASSVLFRPPWRVIAVRAVATLPPVLLAAVWYWGFSGTGYAATPSLWIVSPLERVTSQWLAYSSLGGLRGPTELLVLLAVAVWVGAGLWQQRSALGEAVDWQLAACGAMLFAVALVAPNRYQNTTLFAERWVPSAAVLIALAAPAPLVGPALGRAVALALLGALSLSTAASWRVFDRHEMSGLSESLDALPPARRLLGLDFVRSSEVVHGHPFMQAAAYAQVAKGATLNFSFVEFPHSLVTLAPGERSKRAWTQGLEWHPEWLRRSDLALFDYALVNAGDRQHDALVEDLRLAPVTSRGRWRLYRTPAAGDGEAPR